MGRFLSASQIKRLGDRIARSAEATKEDRELLQRLIADYVEPMALVQDRIRNELGLDSTARPKTEKTTIEKLRRDRTRLNKMQDLAGVRINAPMTLAEQDAIVERLGSLFPGAEVNDLRNREGNPYRAVHVVTSVAECPVEIQVRTPLQHAWADVFERLADATDRRIRYGAIPRDEKARVLYDALVTLAPAFRRIEEKRTAMLEQAAEGARLHSELLEFGTLGPVGSPVRRERDLTLRRFRYSRKKLDRDIEQDEAWEKETVELFHNVARTIREGRRKFERGIVE